MAESLTFTIEFEIDSRLPTTQDLADLSDLRRPLQALHSVKVGSGMRLDRMRPGVPYNHIDLSQLVVTAGAAVTSTALTSVIVEWLRGRSDRRAKLRLGDNEIELLRADDATVAKLMQLFEEANRSRDDHDPDER
jgi:hypothetical protein